MPANTSGDGTGRREGQSEDKIEDAIKAGLSTASLPAGVVGLATNYAMQGVPVSGLPGAGVGGGAAVDTLLAGGEIAGGAAAGGIVVAAAAVVGSAAIGYKAGTLINDATGLSVKNAVAANEADQATMVDAREHWETALDEAAHGDNLGTYVDVILSAGEFTKATDENLIDKVGGLTADVGEATAELGADILKDIL